MSLIQIENMEFYAYHGCFDEEQIVGNKFKVNLELETNTTIAENSDNIEDALNYQTAYLVVKKQMEVKSKLLEHVCNRILTALYERFPDKIIKARVKVSKMNPPMGGQMECVSLQLER
ncbi:MAG: dihydroneopterin aldolase [Bacteroidales bacterium]|nr:dihydroneopterin aldolase [Bacteroidales bacterium]